MKVAVGYLRQRRRKVEKRIYGPACHVPAPVTQVALPVEEENEPREREAEQRALLAADSESGAHD